MSKCFWDWGLGLVLGLLHNDYKLIIDSVSQEFCRMIKISKN